MHLDLALSPPAVTRTLLLIAALLVVASVLGQLAAHLLPDLPLKEEVATAFDVNAERSIPTAFSVLCLLAGAGLSATIAVGERRRGGRDAGRWTALAVLFVALGLDDYMAVHEQANEPVRAALGASVGGYLHWAWVVPGTLFVLVVGLAFVGFLLRLPVATRRGLVMAGLLFVGGALGVELVGGVIAGMQGTDNLGYELAATVEETLEMTGAIFFISVLLRHLDAQLGGFSWGLRSAGR